MYKKFKSKQNQVPAFRDSYVGGLTAQKAKGMGEGCARGLGASTRELSREPAGVSFPAHSLGPEDFMIEMTCFQLCLYCIVAIG